MTEGVSCVAADSVMLRAGLPARVMAGFIMIIMPQLLVMGVAAAEEKEVTEE